MTTTAMERIAAKVREAQARAAQAFGAESHGWRMGPALTSAEVVAAEARYGIALPAEYRDFVTKIGDGGAGPAYGMFPLASALRASDADAYPELMRTPFPHAAAFNPEHDPASVAFWSRMDRGEATDEDADRHVAFERSGALVLCDEGCGYLHFLVVTGPARGTMWMDARGTEGGFVPLGATFPEWYERWVDDVLAGGRGTWWLQPPVR